MAISTNPLIEIGVKVFLAGINCISSRADNQFKRYPPSAIIGLSILTVLGMQFLHKRTQPRWGESRLQQLGRLCLAIPYVKNKFNQDVNKEYVKMQHSILEKWAPFGEPLKALPETGWNFSEIIELIQKYSHITSQKLLKKHISGTVYSNNFVPEIPKWCPSVQENEIDESSDTTYFAALADTLAKIHTFAFHESHLWNSLHADEFAVGAFIDYQVIRMVAAMFGGAPDEVMGFVTSGGTESLMLAMRVYRNWGIKTHGHQPGEGVIIAGRSVHAAILKAQVASFIQVVLIDTNEKGEIDLTLLEKMLKKHGDKVIALIGSAPSYATGIIDQIQQMGKIALEHGCGMHVDSCLGGFIVNNLEQHQTDYLIMPGITSLSADTHKNGQAPKGSSVLVTKKLGEKNLAAYSIYSNADWDGGIYGTPKDAGSQSCTGSLNAFITMLAIGKSGYKRIAAAIHHRAVELAATIHAFEGQLRLLAAPQVNVVSFKIDEKWGLEKGATYALAYEMAKRGFILNTMQKDRVHFCVTLRYVCDLKAASNFKRAIEESLEAVEILNQQFKSEGKAFPGDAGMYCALGNTLTPSPANLSAQKYFENMLLGTQGASEAVEAFYLAQLDPFQASPYQTPYGV